MPANTSPTYTLTANLGRGVITASTTANVKSDGTGTIATDLVKVFTAGANGSFIERIVFMPQASTAATATTPTTLRAFVSSITSGATTNADTNNIGEVSAAAQTADHSTNAIFPLVIPVNERIPASYTILVSTHVVAAANTNWGVVVWAGDY